MTDWRATFARRLSVLAGIFVAWVGVVEARLVYLHVVQHAALLERADEQQQSRQLIPAPRGEITARDGSPLAVTVTGYALEATRSLIADPDATRRAPLRGAARLRRRRASDAGEAAALVRPRRPLRVPPPQADATTRRRRCGRSTSRTCASSRCRSARIRVATPRRT